MNLKIWIVENDPKYRDTLVSYLALLGYQARVFSSGETCVKYLDEEPDIVILDHNLIGDVKGGDVVRKIKLEHEKTSVIHLSSKEKVSMFSDLYKNGTDDVIGKDSASLLRLKIKLEQISALTEGKLKKRRQFVILSTVLALALLLSLIVLVIWSRTAT